MTLLGMEGFDHRSTQPRPGNTISMGQSGFTTGRFGYGSALYSGVSTGGLIWTQALTPNVNTFVTGFAWQGDRSYTNSGVEIGGGGAGHLFITINANRGFDVLRGLGGAVIASSANSVYTFNTWCYLEIKCTIADSGGRLTVRMNGSQIIDFTGDTRNGGTAAQVDYMNVRFGNAVGPLNFIDDWYWLDSTGSAPYNDFLGDVKIETLIPTSAGASTQFTPSTGANWAAVDEIPASMADYVQSSTPGQRDSYTMSDLVTAVGQVLAARPIALALKSDAGAASLRVNSRSSGGTVRQGAAQTLSPSALWYLGDLQTTDPDGAAWTVASLNSAEFGVEVG